MSATTLAAAAVVVFIATTLGDVTVGALVAGVFSLINSVLNGLMLHRQSRLDRGQQRLEKGVERTHKILTAPRRALYDSDGRLVATMLKLEDGEEQIVPPQRGTDPTDPDALG